jgi:hypothetical protein
MRASISISTVTGWRIDRHDDASFVRHLQSCFGGRPPVRFGFAFVLTFLLAACASAPDPCSSRSRGQVHHRHYDFEVLNAVYRECFPRNKPVRTTVGVNGLPLGARVEIECIVAIR